MLTKWHTPCHTGSAPPTVPKRLLFRAQHFCPVLLRQQLNIYLQSTKDQQTLSRSVSCTGLSFWPHCGNMKYLMVLWTGLSVLSPAFPQWTNQKVLKTTNKFRDMSVKKNFEIVNVPLKPISSLLQWAAASGYRRWNRSIIASDRRKPCSLGSFFSSHIN